RTTRPRRQSPKAQTGSQPDRQRLVAPVDVFRVVNEPRGHAANRRRHKPALSRADRILDGKDGALTRGEWIRHARDDRVFYASRHTLSRPPIFGLSDDSAVFSRHPLNNNSKPVVSDVGFSAHSTAGRRGH
ncbi:MAG: hypothetical protein ACO3FE_23605, partial [Planctomycetaceae bacterium]